MDARPDVPGRQSDPAADDGMMARIAAGDALAVRIVATREAPRVLALARRMLGDAAEAEDIAQEAMVRLWRIAPDWRPGEARISTWLHRVAANLCVDHLRKRGRLRPETEAPDMADDRPSAMADLQTAERRAALAAAIDRLPDRQRAALTLRHFAELSNPDIAAQLGVSVEAVESLIARAKRGLAKTLAPQRRAIGLS